jgi:DNA-binding CsgD family transcriptional regulator
MKKLSPRQRQVLFRMACGDSIKECAANLGISPHTVKFHFLDVERRLGVNNRVSAVVRGLQLGLIELASLTVGATS